MVRVSFFIAKIVFFSLFFVVSDLDPIGGKIKYVTKCIYKILLAYLQSLSVSIKTSVRLSKVLLSYHLIGEAT